MNYPPPQQQPPLQPLKKKGGGCLLALGIAGAGLVVVGIVIMVVAYKFMSSSSGQGVVEASKLAMESLQAPGTAELRGIGCAQAAVVDTERMEAVVRKFADDAAATLPNRDFKLQITCQARASGTTPTCEEVARTYHDAVTTPAGRYLVSVNASGSKTASCFALYEPDGTKIRDLTP